MAPRISDDAENAGAESWGPKGKTSVVIPGPFSGA